MFSIKAEILDTIYAQNFIVPSPIQVLYFILLIEFLEIFNSVNNCTSTLKLYEKILQHETVVKVSKCKYLHVFKFLFTQYVVLFDRMIKLYACTKPSCILRSAEFMYMHFYTYIHVSICIFEALCLQKQAWPVLLQGDDLIGIAQVRKYLYNIKIIYEFALWFMMLYWGDISSIFKFS